jgi:uncharacterized protein YbaR (Trm112 family)
MIDTELLKILCCPETHQRLALAPAELVDKLNRQIAAGTLSNRAEKPVADPLDGGLVRADGQILYPVRAGIPVMLINEGIRLERP